MPDQGGPFLTSYHLYRRVPDLDAASEMLESAFRLARNSPDIQLERVGLALDRFDLEGVKSAWSDIDADTAKFSDALYHFARRALVFQIDRIDAFRSDIVRRMCRQPVRSVDYWVPDLIGAICELLYSHSYETYLSVRSDIRSLLKSNPDWIDATEIFEDLSLFFDLYESDEVALERLVDFVVTTPSSRVYPCFFALGNRNFKLFSEGSQSIEGGIRDSRFDEMGKYRALVFSSIINQSISGKLRSEQIGVSASSDAEPYLRRVPQDKGLIYTASVARARVNRRSQSDRLRIALCVSGQLRGYRKALASWSALRLGEHEVVPFVHVWESIGRKYPWPSHSHRSFTGDFLHAFNAASAELGFDVLQQRYKSFFQNFVSFDRAASSELRDAYQTDYVIVQDDTSPEFTGWDNMRKMQYKILQAHQLAMSTGIEFDLFIRIRPDKTIIQADGVDWRSIRRTSLDERVIFSDFGFNLHPHLGFIAGDQFAVGAGPAMNVYASTYVATSFSEQLNHPTMPTAFTPHTNFAFNTLNNGVEMRTMPDVVFGDPIDADQIPVDVIRELILADIGGRDPDRIDSMLLDACENDALRH